MPRVQFVGQISLSYGNTLPELCSRLKNFGVNRMFVRTAQDQNREVSYVVLTQSRPVITRKPPNILVGKLDEISAITRKALDTHSEFYGRVVERGVLLNGGQEMKIRSATNPDWRLIRREEEHNYLKNTIQTKDESKKTSEQLSRSPLHEHVTDILKFWKRANG